MSHYAIIDSSGNVVNSVVLDPSALLPMSSTDQNTGDTIDIPALWVAPDGCIAIESDVASIGWTYTNGEFTAPPVPQITIEAPTPPTLADLQAQLAAITAQINAFAGAQS